MERINKILLWSSFILVIIGLVFIGASSTIKEGLNYGRSVSPFASTAPPDDSTQFGPVSIS